MAWAVVAVTAVSAGVKIYQANKNAKLAKKNAAKAKSKEEIERAKLEKEKEEYKSMKFENPYTNMENMYEDLTVNQQEAQFQAQQGQQQRANIMQGLQGAAGGSGIAGLAQSMAQQGQLQTQQMSASIGQQEARNQALSAGAATNIQSAERKGQQLVQEHEAGKQATLLGMQMGTTSGANAASQQAQANQMQAEMALNQSYADGASSVAGAYAGGAGGMGGGGGGGNSLPQGHYEHADAGHGATYDPNKDYSDRKLKKNIKKISKSPSGLNIYSFEFKDSKYGKGVFQGVMSNEVPKKAVIKKDGYDMVDYSKLDVEFKQI